MVVLPTSDLRDTDLGFPPEKGNGGCKNNVFNKGNNAKRRTIIIALD
jgi:hypothetical protein